MRHVPFSYNLLLDLQWRKTTENLCQWSQILLNINCCADMATTWANWLIELFLPSVKTMDDIRQSLVGTVGLQVVNLKGSSSSSGPGAYAPDAPQSCRLIVLPLYYSSVFRCSHFHHQSVSLVRVTRQTP